MNNSSHQIKNYKLRESKRKLVSLEIARRKRAELNDLINKELRIKNGAENLLSVCNNPQTRERLKLELTFVESKISYLKDQLNELNCDFTLYKMKTTTSNQKKKLMNSLSSSSTSSYSSYDSTKQFPALREILITASKNKPIDYFQSDVSYASSTSFVNSLKSTELMIYLNLKESTNLDFSKGFKEFIATHYRENSSNYNEQIRQFNYFRESTIRLSYEPSLDSIKRLFEYYNSLFLIEKRFFRDSKCKNIHFTWFDSINGVESTQKSIQFEKAAIMFNCATLFTQLAAICCDGNAQKLEEELIYWQRATGCLHYLNSTFTNSPNSDMCPFVLSFLIDIFKCQAYETKAKLLIAPLDFRTSPNNDSKYDPKQVFVNYTHSARIYAHISEVYSKIKIKLDSNNTIKNYLPEIWYNLIKVKAIFYQGLSHYYSADAIITHGIEKFHDNLEVQMAFHNLYDYKSLSKTKNINIRQTSLDYCNKIPVEQQKFYNTNIIQDEKKFHLARAHIKESIIWHEEAIRQHSLCRKFSKDDYLHSLLRYHHDLSLDKFMQLENIPSDGFETELFDVFSINCILDDKLTICLIEPNFQQYESKDFFNIIGPLKVYSSELVISVPFTCVLKRNQNQQSLGLTVKGDCPVRVNYVDPKSLAFHVGIREGDYIIAIQDHDVRWSKHSQVVEKIRSYPNIIKLTLVNAKPIPREATTICDEINSTKNLSTIKSSTVSRKINDSTTHSKLQSPKSVKSSIKLFDFPNKGSPKTNETPNKKAASQAPILFNKEDDEIYNDRENVNFWQHFKSVRMPSFTNTITLGRKFKRNVLKMSIFKTFSISNENSNPNEGSVGIVKNLEKSENKSFLLKELWSNEIKNFNETYKKSYSRNKLLRFNKQKKILQKAIDSIPKNPDNHTNIINSGRLLSYRSNLYKTL